MKMYTIDGALLTERPEIRLGDKVYPVDDRKSTVEKIMKISQEQGSDSGMGYLKTMEEMLELALGKKGAEEIAAMDLRYAVYTRLVETIMAIISGDSPEEVRARFQKREETA